MYAFVQMFPTCQSLTNNMPKCRRRVNHLLIWAPTALCGPSQCCHCFPHSTGFVLRTGHHITQHRATHTQYMFKCPWNLDTPAQAMTSQRVKDKCPQNPTPPLLDHILSTQNPGNPCPYGPESVSSAYMAQSQCLST